MNLRNLFILIGCVLCIVSFNLIFGKQIEIDGVAEPIRGNVALFGDGDYRSAVPTTVAYFVVLLMAIFSFILPLLLEKGLNKKPFCFALIGLAFVASIFFFLEAVFFKSVNDINAKVSLGSAAIFSGIVIILSGGAFLTASLIKEQK